MIVSDDPTLIKQLKRMGRPSLLTPDPSSAVMEAELVITRNWKDLPTRLGSIPVLAITDDVDEALANGVTEILREPFSEALLSIRIQRTLDSRRLADPSSEPGGARDLLPRLLDASPDPIMAADLKGQVLVFSAAAERLLGYSSEEVLGTMHVGEFYAKKGIASRLMNTMREDPEQRVLGMRVRLRNRQGEAIPVVLGAALVHDFAGRPVASVGIFRDDRINRSLTQRLAAATEQLEESEKRAAGVIGTSVAAYELNQPLTTAMGLLELHELETTDSASLDRVSRTREQLQRMRDIVSRLSGMQSQTYIDHEETSEL